MKKYTFLLLCAPLMIFNGCGKEKKEAASVPVAEAKHEWTEKNMLEFERNCIGFLESEDVENAKIYCDCLLESSVEAYPDPLRSWCYWLHPLLLQLGFHFLRRRGPLLERIPRPPHGYPPGYRMRLDSRPR